MKGRYSMIYDEIPVLKSIKQYANSRVLPFHMPGHKRGSIFQKLGLSELMDNFMEMDTTEVPGIDNLHRPEGAIMEAQALAAKAFGADYTFFLVNGTTCGIYAMILAATKPGDKIIIPRNAHRSAVSGTILGRLNPKYIMPEIDPYMDIPMGIRPSTVKKALEENPDATVVLITNPTYYGICSDIKEIANIVHSKGKLLLVDEAHGAHFAFHSNLPISAMEAGADMAAQSTHKTLTSMTGSSMLHVKGDKVDIEKLKFYLQLLQTTSPSHLMLASLDLARYIMEKHGHILLNECIKYSNMVRYEINNKSSFYCLEESKINSHGIYDLDPTRITVCLKEGGIEGVKGEKVLREKYNIQVEMSDFWNIVAIASIADDKDSYIKFSKAILDINQRYHKEKLSLPKVTFPNLEPVCSMAPYQALHYETEFVDIEDSLGRISAEMAVPYPPGIPILMPGEYIQREIIDYLTHCIASGIKISGIFDTSIKKIKVIK